MISCCSCSVSHGIRVLYSLLRPFPPKQIEDTDADRTHPSLGAGAYARGQNLGVLRNNPAAVKVVFEVRNLAYTDHAWALRFEELRQRDSEKILRGVLNYATGQG